jgi:hypothetical protein
MQNNNEKTQMTVYMEKLQNNVEKLRDDVRRLEMRMATLSNLDTEKIARDIESGEPPHEAAAKCQRCRSCKYMRMPHRSNVHYTCEVRHTTIEPTWTCGLYYDKRNQKISESGACC